MMMNELPFIKQITGENRRRWFTSANMDLIIWINPLDQPVNFELCYDKQHQEKSLRWSTQGHSHCIIDNGENRAGRYKSSPIHCASSGLDARKLRDLFEAGSQLIPESLRLFVLHALTTA